jgi:nucleoside-diphosphate-sugar epimerase
LLKLYSGVRAPYYITELPWNGLHRDFGLTPDTIHLITREEIVTPVREGSESNVLDKVLNLLDLSESDFSPEVPFTSYGMDSLAATRISEALRSYVKVSQMQLLGGMTWNQLEAKMREADTAVDGGPMVNTTTPLLDMVEKYSKNFRDHTPSSKAPTGEVILITGTSGSVGSSILVKCLECPNVKHIYALNRPSSDPVQAQKAAFAKRGFNPSLVDSSRLTLLNSDLTACDLGLGKSLLEEICKTVTHVIHTSWLVNFVLDLSQFELLIKGTRNLIDLALLSPLPSPPRFVFISSVMVLRGCEYSFLLFIPASILHFGSAMQNHELCSEEFVGPELALGSGYSESKWVTERLLQVAATQTSLCPIIARVDQVSGSSNGYWKKAEWFPSLVQSATIIKCLPDSPTVRGTCFRLLVINILTIISFSLPTGFLWKLSVLPSLKSAIHHRASSISHTQDRFHGDISLAGCPRPSIFP